MGVGAERPTSGDQSLVVRVAERPVWRVLVVLSALMGLPVLGEGPPPAGRWLRLDAAGVSVRDGKTIPWAALAEVRVPSPSVQRSHWRRWWPDSKQVSLVTTAQFTFARRAGVGADPALVIPLTWVDVSSADLIAAVRQWSDVPIREG